MTAPWGFAVAGREAASFHLVVHGECWLEVDGVEEKYHLSSGDLVIVPSGAPHRVRDDPASKVEWLEDILASHPEVDGRLAHGGDGRLTEIVCGGFEIEPGQAMRVLAALPSVVLVQGSSGRPPSWVTSIL